MSDREDIDNSSDASRDGYYRRGSDSEYSNDSSGGEEDGDGAMRIRMSLW